MRIFVPGALAIAVLLAGCASPAEQSSRAQQQVERMMQIYGPACDKLGFKRETDAWRDCVLRLSARDEAPRYSYYGYYYSPLVYPYYPYSRWMY